MPTKRKIKVEDMAKFVVLEFIQEQGLKEKFVKKYKKHFNIGDGSVETDPSLSRHFPKIEDALRAYKRYRREKWMEEKAKIIMKMDKLQEAQDAKITGKKNFVKVTSTNSKDNKVAAPIKNKAIEVKDDRTKNDLKEEKKSKDDSKAPNHNGKPNEKREEKRKADPEKVPVEEQRKPEISLPSEVKQGTKENFNPKENPKDGKKNEKKNDVFNADVKTSEESHRSETLGKEEKKDVCEQVAPQQTKVLEEKASSGKSIPGIRLKRPIHCLNCYQYGHSTASCLRSHEVLGVRLVLGDPNVLRIDENLKFLRVKKEFNECGPSLDENNEIAGGASQTVKRKQPDEELVQDSVKVTKVSKGSVEKTSNQKCLAFDDDDEPSSYKTSSHHFQAMECRGQCGRGRGPRARGRARARGMPKPRYLDNY